MQEAKNTKRILTGTERVLLIDDEEMPAKMGKTMLKRLGYRVTERSSSAEALKVFESDPDQFDLVITDQTMPGLTGVEVAERIFSIRPNMPIILCTGYSSLISEETAKAMGIKGFVMKPLSQTTIAVHIREILGGQENV